MYRSLVLFVTAFVANSASAAGIGGRIVGGSTAPDAAYPYQVSLRYNNNHYCGGSIISNQWIMTSARCISIFDQIVPSRIQVYVGTNKLNEGGVMYLGNRAIRHPNWNPFTLENDIGLIRVNRIIEFNARVNRVPLPVENFTKINYPGRLTGWGRLGFPGATPNDLQEIILNIISQSDCSAAGLPIRDSNICTFNGEGQGACTGDDGGPLVADGFQIGILSYGVPCAVGVPDVFTRVWTYINWINGYIA